jgi:hypothetical protein
LIFLCLYDLLNKKIVHCNSFHLSHCISTEQIVVKFNRTFEISSSEIFQPRLLSFISSIRR